MDTTGSVPRESWTEHVQIREVGGPSAEAGDAAEYSGRPEGDDAAALLPAAAPARKRPYRAAWLLTAVLIAVGVLWLGGAFEHATSYPYTTTVDAGTGMATQTEFPPLILQLRKLGFVAPAFLIVGTISALALLIVQGSQRSREAHATGR